MKTRKNRNILLLLIILTNIFTLTGCKNKQEKLREIEPINENELFEINESNAIVLEVENVQTVIKENNENKVRQVKIKNISPFDLSNISIKYEEFDSEKNVVAQLEALLDMTLSSKESAYITIEYKEYVEDVEIVSYNYSTLGKDVFVNLKNNKSNIINNIDKIENSKNYEVLSTSEIYELKKDEKVKVNALKVKNTSKGELGNITIKIAQLNENGEYIKIDNIVLYEILKPLEEKELEIVVSKDVAESELVGYSYDAIKQQAKISVDLKAEIAHINKNE